MSRNLDNFKTNNSHNQDWNIWVKLVKKAYKSQGYNLTQQQALILAKESYPGKGNVLNKLENNELIEPDLIQISKELPKNPTRRKKEKIPKSPPEVYNRSRQNYQDRRQRPQDRDNRYYDRYYDRDYERDYDRDYDRDFDRDYERDYEMKPKQRRDYDRDDRDDRDYIKENMRRKETRNQSRDRRDTRDRHYRDYD